MGLLMSVHMAVSIEDRLGEGECDLDPVGYTIPDPLYCDRYLDCDPVTGRNLRLCPTGQVVNQERGVCEDQREVQCGTRQQLWRNSVQTTKSQSKNLAPPQGARLVAPAAHPQVPGLAAHAAAEAEAVRAKQAQFPRTEGPKEHQATLELLELWELLEILDLLVYVDRLVVLHFKE